MPGSPVSDTRSEKFDNVETGPVDSLQPMSYSHIRAAMPISREKKETADPRLQPDASSQAGDESYTREKEQKQLLSNQADNPKINALLTHVATGNQALVKTLLGDKKASLMLARGSLVISGRQFNHLTPIQCAVLAANSHQKLDDQPMIRMMFSYLHYKSIYLQLTELQDQVVQGSMTHISDALNNLIKLIEREHLELQNKKQAADAAQPSQCNLMH